MVASIAETCLAIQQQMNRAWQKLPISHQFPEPLPLQTDVAVYHGGQPIEPHTLLSVGEALDFALPRLNLPVYLTGRPGGGKTSAMKWIAMLLAKRHLEGTSEWLPVYVDLGQLTSLDPKQPVQSLVQQVLQRTVPVDYSSFQSVESGPIWLLDGLDIMSGNLTARDLVEAACQESSIKFLIAGRNDEQVVRLLDDYPSTVRIQLGALNKGQREQWFRMHASSAAQAKYFSLVSSNSHIDSLLETPLLFAMAASACIDEESDTTFRTDRYSGRTGIFAGFVDYALRRAVWQGHLHRNDVGVFEQGFANVCALLLLAARNGHRDRVSRTVMEQVLAESGRSGVPGVGSTGSTDWMRMRQILIAIGLLEPAGDTYIFLHQQFAEYMAGFGLAQCWFHTNNERQLYDSLANDLRHRDRDAIVSHALSITVRLPHSRRVLDAAVQMILRVDPTDACDLLSSTAAPELVGYLTSLSALNRNDKVTSLFAISGLSRLPHLDAVWAIEAILADTSYDAHPLVRAAVKALATHPLDEGKVILSSLVDDPSRPDWLRLAAASELPSAQHPTVILEFATAVAFDASRDEESRIDAIRVLERSGTSSGQQVLRRLAKEAESSVSVRLQAEAAVANSISRKGRPDNSLASELNSLAVANLNSALWLLQATTSRVASIARSNPADPALSAATAAMVRLKLLSPSQAIKELESLIQQLLQGSDGVEASQQLIQLCDQRPAVFESLERHSQRSQLRESLIQSCARACGRRWIPEYESLSAQLPNQTADARVAKNAPPRKRSGKHRTKLLPKDEVMRSYLEIAKGRGEKITIENAKVFADSMQSPHSTGALGSTVEWQDHMAEMELERERERERERQAKTRKPQRLPRQLGDRSATDDQE